MVQRKLTSRKFWLTVVAVLTAVAAWLAGEVESTEAVWAVVAAVASYTGVEGAGDALQRLRYPPNEH